MCRKCHGKTTNNWLRDNPNKKKIYIYTYNHKPETKERLKEWRKHNVPYKIGKACRKRIAYALKAQKLVKSKHTEELLGCSIKALKEHLQFHFSAGMSWLNYGPNGWHIDHTIPCSAFDLTKLEEQKKCFHFTNLRPMWAADNRKKGDKLSNGKLGRNLIPSATQPHSP